MNNETFFVLVSTVCNTLCNRNLNLLKCVFSWQARSFQCQTELENPKLKSINVNQPLRDGGAGAGVFCCLGSCVFGAGVLFCVRGLAGGRVSAFMSVFVSGLRGFGGFGFLGALAVGSRFGQKFVRILVSQLGPSRLGSLGRYGFRMGVDVGIWPIAGLCARSGVFASGVPVLSGGGLPLLRLLS